MKLCRNNNNKNKKTDNSSSVSCRSQGKLFVICILKKVILSVTFLLNMIQHGDLFCKQAGYKDMGANVCVRPYRKAYKVFHWVNAPQLCEVDITISTLRTRWEERR